MPGWVQRQRAQQRKVRQLLTPRTVRAHRRDAPWTDQPYISASENVPELTYQGDEDAQSQEKPGPTEH
jgi:hypothetical protein